MEKKGNSGLNIALIHPGLGIGGAERLIVDAAAELLQNLHPMVTRFIFSQLTTTELDVLRRLLPEPFE